MLNKAEKVLLNSGSIAVIPTDTIYGLVAIAQDKQAVEKLYSLKNRQNKPGTVIAADINQLENLGIKHRYLSPLTQYWPGPISVIVPLSGDNLYYLSQNSPTLAVRIPDKKELVDLLKTTGPLLTTSVNKPGETPAGDINEAKKIFGDKVDIYIDGGDLSKNQSSTLLRIIDDAVDIIRQGAGKVPLS
ncbi:MAG TPA: L-threonylcarbamoyladenylate synthase [Patescibacteria group bacterium]|nr:L-threonylcarbamoyladenylate synthase [Patescibacteria group bacterium]